MAWSVPLISHAIIQQAFYFLEHILKIVDIG